MKKRILMILFSSVSFAVLLPAVAFAASAGSEGVTGVVTSSGNIVIGAQVVVVCDGNTITTTTSSTGIYSVQYNVTQCPNKALAKVTATYGGQSGSNSGEIKDDNLILTDKPSATAVPVLSLVTGATATVLGSVGYLTIRRS